MNGEINTTGQIKLLDFVHHRDVAIVLKLVYKVQFQSSTDQTENRVQEYVIAHGVHMPNITEKNTFVEDIVRVDLNMGPGVAVTGDIIWDQT